MPTGGFSTKNASVAHFDSLYIDIVITVFMLLAGINFSLHYQFCGADRWLSGRIRNAGFTWPCASS
jgi:Trk-type K+ transport system membrane component